MIINDTARRKEFLADTAPRNWCSDSFPEPQLGSVWEAAQQEKARRSGPSSSWKELARSPPARPRSCAITAKLRHAPVAQAPGGPQAGTEPRPFAEAHQGQFQGPAAGSYADEPPLRSPNAITEPGG